MVGYIVEQTMKMIGEKECLMRRLRAIGYM